MKRRKIKHGQNKRKRVLWILGILLIGYLTQTNALLSLMSNDLQVPLTAAATEVTRPLDPAFHDSDVGVPNDAKPDGVPSHYTWYESATQPGLGNHPPRDWRAITMFGGVYAAKGWRPAQAPNTRVQIKGAETWILSKSTNRWTQVQSTDRVQGADYVADFKDDQNRPAQMKDESRNGGGISIQTGDGYMFHFWAKRGTINPTDIAAVYAKFEARLVQDNPNGPDDRAKARYIASAGADYWRNQTAEWAADWSNNGQVASGRFKWVTKDWKVFAMTTIPAAEMKKNPPPLKR